jgi:hypothetical protein
MAREIVLQNPGAPDGIVVVIDGAAVSFKKLSDGTAITPATATAATSATSATSATAAAAISGVETTVADLTENAGAIGGTNDGDIPDLSSADAAANAAAVRELATTVNAILAALRDVGVIASS